MSILIYNYLYFNDFTFDFSISWVYLCAELLFFYSQHKVLEIYQIAECKLIVGWSLKIFLINKIDIKSGFIKIFW